DTTPTTVTSTTPESTAATTDTVPTPTTPTTVAPTTTTRAPRPLPRPKPTQASQRLPSGVTIGGIHVGGLGPDAAYQTIRLAFDSPLKLIGGERRLAVSPGTLGAVAYVKEAIAEARRAAPHSTVRLPVHVQGPLVAAYVAS